MVAVGLILLAANVVGFVVVVLVVVLVVKVLLLVGFACPLPSCVSPRMLVADGVAAVDDDLEEDEVVDDSLLVLNLLVLVLLWETWPVVAATTTLGATPERPVILLLLLLAVELLVVEVVWVLVFGWCEMELRGEALRAEFRLAVAAEPAVVPAAPPVSDRLAPIRVSAMMAVTAFCQRRLTTYFLSFVLSNCWALPFLAGVFASHLCCKQSFGLSRFEGSLMSSLAIKSLASSEMGSKDSSSKS